MRNALVTRILSLIALIALIPYFSADEAKVLHMNRGPACEKPARSPATDWLNECMLPAPWEDRVVHLNKFGEEQLSYRITRLADSVRGQVRVQIAVPIEYVSEIGATESGSREFFTQSRARAMRARAEECLRIASPHLRGLDGEQITVRLMESGLPATRVFVKKETSAEFRSTPKEYASDLECHQIVHETLHLLGLSDEYQDITDPELLPCLAAETGPSLMRNQEEGWGLTFGGVRQRRYELRGVGGLAQLKRARARVKDPATDEKAILLSTDVFAGHAEKHGERYVLKEKPPLSSNGLFKIEYATFERVAGDGRSLLRRGQVRKMLYPGCDSLNRVYNECTRYRDLGEARLKEQGCQPLPPFCRDPSWVDQ